MIFNFSESDDTAITVECRMVYLDMRLTTNGDGTKTAPFNSFSTAITSAGEGGVIVLLSPVVISEDFVGWCGCLVCKDPDFVDPYDDTGENPAMFRITGGDVTIGGMTIDCGTLTEDDEDDGTDVETE